MKTCCFTGHRPAKLKWRYTERGIAFVLFRKKLKKAILTAIKNGYTYFISGMALGTDMLAAELVLKLKEKHPNIKLECALPCKNQDSKWTEKCKQRYKNILLTADTIVYVSEAYFSGCMQKRNRYMVNMSTLVIAAYNGTSDGTKQTLEYAKSKNKDIVIISV